MYVRSYREGLSLFKALGSDARVRILELLIEKGPMLMTSIADELEVTGGSVTAHIRMLHEAGLISIQEQKGRHGKRKVCSIINRGIMVEPPLGET